MKLLFVLSVAGLAFVPAPQSPPKPDLIAPPFVRQWTHLTGEQVWVVAVRDGRVYHCSHSGVGAVDLQTGQSQWKSLPNHNIRDAVMQGQILYLLAQTEKQSTLEAVGAETGQSRTLVKFTAQPHSIAADASRLYVLEETGELKTYEPNSGKQIWTRQLGAKRTRGVLLANLMVNRSGIYAGLDGAGEFGVDPQSGKILWQRRAEYAGLYPPIALENDVITQVSGVKRIDIRTGKVIWKSDEGYGDAVLANNVVMAADERNIHLVGRDAANGRVLWKLPLRDKDRSYGGGGDKSASSISDKNSVWLHREPFLSVTMDGREQWHAAHPFTGSPQYADSERVVTEDGERILCYVAGTLPPLPTSDTDKQAFAERLTAQYERIDDAEREQLKSLVPYAFPLLLKRWVEWENAWTASAGEKDGMRLYGLLTESMPLLHATCRKEDTAAIVAAWTSLSAKSEWRDNLERLLQDKGDPTGYVPVLVSTLRRLPPDQRRESAALTAVSHSSHPDAVSFMLAALADPKAAPAWRQEAFQHLAGTGGEQGITAVRAARKTRRARKPWQQRIVFPEPKHNFCLGIKTDRKGRTWMLFHSPVLGNYTDVFVVQKQGGKWGQPVFTGAWTGRTFHHEAPKTFRGIPLAKLLKSEWIRIFPDDASLRRDGDKDGLTDLVEARLGTLPNKADTDSDGLADAVDPCPNAAPRPLTDHEKIVAAALEARFFEENWGVPAVLNVEKMKPFEMYGYESPLLWNVGKGEHPTARFYGGGVNTIGFHHPNRETRNAKDFIEFSSDGQSAHTLIRRYSGGLNGDGIEVWLKKVGDEWFVTDLRTQYVS